MSYTLFVLLDSIHNVLLADLEDIIGQPVEDQPAREIHKENSHDNRHNEHHLLL
jgi:hypothetical protein